MPGVLAVLLMFIAFPALLIYLIVQAIKSARQKREDERQRVFEREREHRLEVEHQKQIDEEKERNRSIVDQVKQDFASLPGWDYWQQHIHGIDSQIERYRRSQEQLDLMDVLAYDAEEGLAKVVGTTGNIYLTHARGCSCKDFYRNRLPCKHMYFLVTLLKKGIMRTLPDAVPLRGVTVLCAGRVSHETRALIEKRGGLITDTMNESNILVYGKNPGEGKIQYAKDVGLLSISEEQLARLFINDKDNSLEP